jgi:hypothetical protein
MLVLSVNLDVKFGFNSKFDQFEIADEMLFRIEWMITVIVLATFGLILIDIFYKKKNTHG